MTEPPTLIHSLYRRLTGVIIIISMFIVGLFGWQNALTGDTAASSHFPVGSEAALIAGVAALVATTTFFWTSKRMPAASALGAYFMLCIAIALLIVQSGGSSSPFIGLWIVTAVFAGIFGLRGVMIMALAPIALLAWQYKLGELSVSDAISVIVAGGLPLILSFVTWAVRSSGPHDPNRAYQQLESELSQVAGKAEVVINAIADGVVALNSKGNIQLINPAAQQLIGWGKHDALTLNYKSVLKLLDAKGGELAPSTDPIATALSTNQEVTSSDLSLITNSGKKLLVSLVISPVGQPGSGVIVVFRDITKEKTDERQQAEFISTASHEMRTPVASIEGYLGLALNPATAQVDEKARDFITKAHEAAQHLGRLFQDLLDVTKAEDGRLANKPAVVDVVAFSKDVVQGLRPKAEAKGLMMIFKPQPDDQENEITTRKLNPVFYANVDNDHLREVISNLVENAIKYTPKGTVAIDVGGDAEHVVISVQDSGIGIPAEDQPHLFQKFYRVDNSDTREIGGTGLGLYLCRRLTEDMEGRIWVESTYKQGSTFFVELPRISHEEAMHLIEEIESKKEADTTQAPVAPQAPAYTTPAPAPTTRSVSSEETVYVNAPAEAVAAQLSSAVQTPAMSSLPTTPSPIEPTKDTKGPSLADIEQNPNQYLRRPGSVSIPPRDQNQP